MAIGIRSSQVTTLVFNIQNSKLNSLSSFHLQAGNAQSSQINAIIPEVITVYGTGDAQIHRESERLNSREHKYYYVALLPAISKMF